MLAGKINPPSVDAEAIATYLKMVAKAGNVPNISVSLRLRGECFSWTTAEQIGEPFRFQIGCVTKAMVAAVVLELDAVGALDIEQPIGAYLAEFEGSVAGEQVLVRNLLSGSAGHRGISSFDNTAIEMTWEGLVAELASAPMLFKPGTVCSLDYSHQVLLGEIVRRVSGRLWMDLVDETVGLPLFGRSLYSEQDRQWLWAPSAASTVLSTDELATLAEVLMTGQCGTSGHRILCQRTVSRLNQTVVRVPELSGERCTHWLPVGYSLGIPQYHSGLRGECGKGQQQLSSIRYSAPDDLTLAVCIGSGNPFVRHDVIDGMLAEFGIGVPEKKDRAPMRVPTEDLPGEYIGLRGVKVNVELDGARVSVTLQGEDGKGSRYLGTLNEDGTFSIDKGQPVAGLAFFADPATGSPAMMVGVHAMRKADSRKEQFP